MTHKLDELKALTDTQAAELYADLKASGMLIPPPGGMAYPVEKLPSNLKALTELLLGQAAAWEGIAPPDSALHHYSNGLIYSLAMLKSCQDTAAAPVQVFVMFGIRCTSFAREVMSDSGLSEAQQEAALESDEGAAAALNALGLPIAKRGTRGSASRDVCRRRCPGPG